MTGGRSRLLAPTTERGVRRRYVLLTGLRWLPVGFLTPVFVLLPLSGGLTLPEVGVFFAVYGLTTASLELPTGGLADSVGRRPTLLLSSVLHIAFFAGLVAADGLGTWLLAAAVGGAARALDSGPLQAWYVDEARRLEPDVELRSGLAAGGVVEGGGLALSALAGGLIPLAAGRSSLEPVVWAAVAAQVVHLAALALLLAEPARHGGMAAALRDGVRQVPRVVRDGVAHGARRGPVRRLLVATAVWGVVLAGVEILWQPRFVDLLGGDATSDVPAGTTALLGVLMAVAFLVSALGSAVAPRFGDRFTSSSGAAVAAAVLQALVFGGLAASALAVPAAVAFAAVYLCNGLRDPFHHQLLHEHVPSERRSTMLSVESLTLQVGGLTSTLALPWLAELFGIPWAWACVAVVLGLSALLYRGIPDRPEAARASADADGATAPLVG